MEMVRHTVTVPTAEDFASSSGGPLVIDQTNGNLYLIDENGVIVLVGASSISVGVGDGTTDDTDAVTEAVAYAYANGAPLYWPAGTYLTTATIPHFHDVQHRGPGIVKRGSNLFYVDPSLHPGATNILYLATTGSNSNDGLSSSEPRLTAKATGDVLYGYSYGDVTWKLNFAAGTYTTAANSWSRAFPTPNRVQFLGDPVATGTQPTTIFQATGHGVGSSVQGLYFQNRIRAQVSDINFKSYRTNASPNASLLSAGIIADSQCELYVSNVWADDCDLGVFATNGSLLRLEGGRYGYSNINGAGASILRSYGTVGYLGSLATINGTTGPAFIGGTYGVLAQEFSMVHPDYCYFSNQTSAGVFSTNSRTNNVSCVFDTCTIGIDARLNSNVQDSSSTFTGCTNDVFARSGSTFVSSNYTDTLVFSSPVREADAVVSSNATASPVNAFTKTFAAKELQNRGSGFDLEIMHSITNTNDTKTVTVTLGAATLLTATIANTTTATFIKVMMRVITATNSLHVMTTINQNGVVPAVAYTNVTTVDLTSASRTLDVTHQVTNVSDTSHIRHVDLKIYR